MCGIAGFAGRFTLHVLESMSAAIAHRGPDDTGQWVSRGGDVGLAHRRLSIIDLSPLGHQPMTHNSGLATIVFNGEIYNFADLRRALEGEGHTFRSRSDTEVLLALYMAKGEAMLPLLNGIFAFAIHDDRDDTLFLACDRFAVKPVYYTETAKGCLFASELKALVRTAEIDTTIDSLALFRTLGFLWSPGGSTPLQAVKRLGPGDALRIKNGRICRQWHWAPAPEFGGSGPDVDAGDAVTSVQRALRTAVHRQMVSDVPVGAFLSGGLDSSAVVAMAREVSPAIECFTIDTGEARDAGVTDDLPYARRAAGHLGVTLHEIQIDSDRMAGELERIVVQLDEPLADPAPLNVLFISQLARRHGVKVLLSGAGGDDIFSGYRRHQALRLERLWAWLPAAARRGLRRTSGALDQRNGVARRAAKAWAQADATPEERIAGYFLWAAPERTLGLFAAEHRATLRSNAMTAPLLDYLRTLPADDDPVQRMLSLEQRFFLPDHNLLYTDKMSMAAGVEVRVPFLDNDLVQYANRLPSRFKQRGREGKWVLKKALEPHLPHDVIYRPKTGFGAPVRRWLRHELRDLVDDTLSSSVIERRGLFDHAAVSKLVKDDRAGRIDAAYTVFALVCIELWCRNFLTEARVDGTGPILVHAGSLC